MFTLLAANIKTGTADLLINIGLLCLGLLCACECRRRLRLYTLGLMLLAIFSALTKVTGLVVAGVTVCVVTADLWLRGRHRLSLALMLGFVAGFLGGWVVLGQRVSQIAAFLSGGLEIAGGYNGAMAVEPPATALAGGVLTLFAALGAVLTRYHAQVAGNTKQKWQQRLLFAWLLLLLFVTWKHGFVRADEHHAIFFLGFASVLSLVLGALPCPTSKPCRWTYQLAGACCLCAVVTLQLLLYPDFLRLDRPFRQAAANAATLLRPGAYCEQMKRSLRLERHRASLPRLREVIGQAPVDVFGNYQAYAVFNDLNYRPRPVFQSYSAYTASLMTVNERFYASGAAPEFVMARLDTIDNRLPVLEDALTFRYLLTNYKPTAHEGGFVLLQSRSAIAPELTLLREGTVRPDELIDLKPYRHSVLWLEIDLEPTVAGRLRQCIYQPSPVWLRAWHTSLTGSSKQFLAPAQMMKAGFVASPLILSNQCLLDLYAGKPVTRPTAYSVEIAPSNRFLWHGVILYRVYTLDNLATAAPDRHSSNRSVPEGHE